jgi:cytochrome c oxidase subunit 1
VFSIYTGISIYWPIIRKVDYRKRIYQAFFGIFFFGVNLVFGPIHIIGIQGAPRKYKELPDRYRSW